MTPHVNDVSSKKSMKSDCTMCSSTGTRFILSVAALNRWNIARTDVKAAFLQTGLAQRDVDVRPTCRSKDKRHYWLLLSVVYELVNASSEFQFQSDEQILTLICHICIVYRRFIYLHKNNNLLLIVAKYVGDLLVTGKPSEGFRFIDTFGAKFIFEAVVHGPGVLILLERQSKNRKINQSIFMPITKLNAIACFPFSRIRQHQFDSLLFKIEMSSFCRLTSRLDGWKFLHPHCAPFMPPAYNKNLLRHL